jgi:hypothetical protein
VAFQRFVELVRRQSVMLLKLVSRRKFRLRIVYWNALVGHHFSFRLPHDPNAFLSSRRGDCSKWRKRVRTRCARVRTNFVSRLMKKNWESVESYTKADERRAQ